MGRTQVAASPDEAWAAINAPDFNPRAVAYLGPPPGSPATLPALDGDPPVGTVAVARPDSDALTATVDTDRAAILVFGEVAYPGWRATIDGQSTPLLTAEQEVQLARRIERGRQHDRLRVGARHLEVRGIAWRQRDLVLARGAGRHVLVGAGAAHHPHV